MDIKIDPNYLLFASFGVIGLIEWVKSLATAIKAKNGSWKWPVLSFVTSALVAVSGTISPFQLATNFVIILSFIEILGYNVLTKLLFSITDGLVSFISPKSSFYVNQLPTTWNATGNQQAPSLPSVSSPVEPTPPASKGLVTGSVPLPPQQTFKDPEIKTEEPDPSIPKVSVYP